MAADASETPSCLIILTRLKHLQDFFGNVHANQPVCCQDTNLVFAPSPLDAEA